MNRRPNQTVEWIGDAALMMLLRWELSEHYPSVSYAALSHVITKLVSNRYLARFGIERLQLLNANEVEIMLGQCVTSGRMTEARSIVAAYVNWIDLPRKELDSAQKTDDWIIKEQFEFKVMAWPGSIEQQKKIQNERAKAKPKKPLPRHEYKTSIDIKVIQGDEGRRTTLYLKKNGCGVFWCPFNAAYTHVTKDLMMSVIKTQEIVRLSSCPKADEVEVVPTLNPNTGSDDCVWKKWKDLSVVERARIANRIFKVRLQDLEAVPCA